MSTSIFRDCSLFKAMIETDDEEEVDKVLNIELEKYMNASQFMNISSSSVIDHFCMGNPYKLVYALLYFGHEDINY